MAIVEDVGVSPLCVGAGLGQLEQTRRSEHLIKLIGMFSSSRLTGSTVVVLRQNNILRSSNEISNVVDRHFSTNKGQQTVRPGSPKVKPLEGIPSRYEQLAKLKAGEEYDVVIIGGGATGSGAALDAASRGLKVACIERGDFASETSSRSTKLIWAGIRYVMSYGRLCTSYWRLRIS